MAKYLGSIKGCYNTNTKKHIRYILEDWKREEIRKADYTCFVSGKKSTKKNSVNLTVHHLTAFDDIIREAHENLGLEFHYNTKDYSKEDLTRLEDEMKRLHIDIPVIVLTKELHDLIHKTYGQNVDLSTIREFKKQYRKARNQTYNATYKKNRKVS